MTRKRRQPRRGSRWDAGDPPALPADADRPNRLDHSYDDLASAAMRQLREIGSEEAVRTFAWRQISTPSNRRVPRQPTVPVTPRSEAAPSGSQRRSAKPATSPPHAGGRADSRCTVCQHHCPVSPCRRIPRIVRNRAAGHGRCSGTHVQRLATIQRDCACTHVPLWPMRPPPPKERPVTLTPGASKSVVARRKPGPGKA